MKHVKWVGLLLAVFCLTCTMAQAEPTKQAGPSLYQRLGEQPGINLLVDSFIFKLKQDKQIGHYFAKTDWTHFKKCFGGWVAATSGGPGTGMCKNMKEHYKGMKMSNADFDAWLADFGWAADHNAVGKWQKQQLMEKLAAMRPGMVDAKAGGKQPAPKGKKTTKPAPKH